MKLQSIDTTTSELGTALLAICTEDENPTGMATVALAEIARAQFTPDQIAQAERSARNLVQAVGSFGTAYGQVCELLIGLSVLADTGEFDE